MDHPLYAYRARQAFGPPRGAQAARGPEPDAAARPAATATALRAFIVLVLEHWDAEPAPQDRRDPRLVGEFGSFRPDWRTWSQREYGLRIGVFRVLDALAAAGLRPAVAANARVLQRLPALVQQLQTLGVEWVAHGETATRMMHSAMPLADQRALVASSVAAVRAATGHAPAGWLSQDWGTTPDTFALLAAAGLRYTLDWTNDDAPFMLRTAPALMAVPLSAEFDDVQCQWMRHLEPRAHADLVRRGFLRLRDEAQAGAGPTVVGLALHPWLCGMASRIGALRALLRDLARLDGLQWALPGEIANHFLCANPGSAP